MSSSLVKSMTPSEVKECLQTLKILLQNLPETVPKNNKYYNFQGWAPDPEKVEDMGMDGAVNNASEVIFCPNGCLSGPFELKEQGDGLTAVVDVLGKQISDFPTNVILQKWVVDLTDSAHFSGAVSIFDTSMINAI